ncbi:hypothetical protein DN410_18555 [Bacillus sp. SH5-2]|nr:hypothetical protein DN410_18555 [Bacillus sp. SH5-2]
MIGREDVFVFVRYVGFKGVDFQELLIPIMSKGLVVFIFRSHLKNNFQMASYFGFLLLYRKIIL